MNPFELTKDQYGSITVRIKSEYIVLTREEARRIEESFIGISGENTKLRKIARAYAAIIECDSFDYCPYEEDCDAETAPMRDGCKLYEELRELGALDE